MSDYRSSLLNSINHELENLGLKPLRKLGDCSKGEIEILSIIAIHEHSKRFFTDVQFAVRFPNTSEGQFTVRFNANGIRSDGAVIVVLLNGLFVIVKQWRLPLGQWTYEIPRGFGEKLDTANIAGKLGTIKIADLPLGTMTRELGEEVMANADISSITHLGNIAENSGTNAVAPSYFLVQIGANEESLANRVSDEALSIKLWTARELRSQFGRKLCDNHSITAAALALNYIESLPR